jgi:O-succinylbenzoic acid--CoA ligase
MLQLGDAERRLGVPAGAMLVVAPPDHGHGLSMVLAGLVRGNCVVLGSGMRPAEQAELAARHSVSTISGVPAQLARLVEDDDSVLDGVRLVVSGSSKLSDALRTRLASRGARVVDCYGSTEAGTVAIEGRPLAGVTIEVDGDRRILISSPLGGRRVPPGDVGHIEGRRLVIDGRVSGVVDSGGELVAPERVAEKLRAMPGVVAARVWAEDDDLLGSVLCAEVDAPGREVAALIAELPPSERPRRF